MFSVLVCIPYVKSISEKFKSTGNQSNIITVFRTKHTLRTDSSYSGKTGRPLAVQLRERRQNYKKGSFRKIKLTQHGYEESSRVIWDKARILQIQNNRRYRT
jgi:hypothetical protein